MTAQRRSRHTARMARQAAAPRERPDARRMLGVVTFARAELHGPGLAAEWEATLRDVDLLASGAFSARMFLTARDATNPEGLLRLLQTISLGSASTTLTALAFPTRLDEAAALRAVQLQPEREQ